MISELRSNSAWWSLVFFTARQHSLLCRAQY